jgi:hypothetical protein
MDHRRQLALGIAELRQQPMHAIEAEIDLVRVQCGQPRNQLVERGLRL